MFSGSFWEDGVMMEELLQLPVIIWSLFHISQKSAGFSAQWNSSWGIFLTTGSFVISDSAWLACDGKGGPHPPTKLPKDANVLASYVLILSLDFLSTESGLCGQRFLPPFVTYKIKCVAIQILMEAHVWSRSSSGYPTDWGLLFEVLWYDTTFFINRTNNRHNCQIHELLSSCGDLVAGFGHCTGHSYLWWYYQLGMHWVAI